jgi:hypothetical protein
MAPLDTARKMRRQGVIVCEHISRESAWIARATRTEPIVPEDSGWQFTCSKDIFEDESTAEIWTIDEILEFDGSLKSFIESEPGSVFCRDVQRGPWKAQKLL